MTPAATYALLRRVRDYARRFGELSAEAEREKWTGQHHGAPTMRVAAWEDLELELGAIERALLEGPPGTITLFPERYGAAQP